MPRVLSGWLGEVAERRETSRAIPDETKALRLGRRFHHPGRRRPGHLLRRWEGVQPRAPTLLSRHEGPGACLYQAETPLLEPDLRDPSRRAAGCDRQEGTVHAFP